MKLFLSYAVIDTEKVVDLQADLAQFGHDVWRDVNIAGGQDWWDEICEQLRDCDAVVFAISPASVRSHYCNAELVYAEQLGRPLIPVTIADTPLSAAGLPAPIRTINAVRYAQQTHESVVALAAALPPGLAGRPLPEPAPAQPGPPLGDLGQLRARIVAPELSPIEQRALVDELQSLADGASDVATDLIALLRRRKELLESVATDLDQLLAQSSDALAPGSEARTMVRALATQVGQGVATPILGTGLTDALIGSRRSMAQEFAEEFEFPLSAYLRGDLPQVAQFVRVTQGSFTLRDRLRTHMHQQLRERLPNDTAGVAPNGTAPSLSLDELFAAAWAGRNTETIDPHELLASFPCPIYVTAHPAQLLQHALRAAGKNPVTEVCRWKSDDGLDDWPPSRFDAAVDRPFEPTVDEPLVFHVFGLLAWPDTLVLTEDDYFRFLIGVTSDRESTVPRVVRRALADSALLVMGFQLDDWDFRTLWQALMSQEGNSRLRHYKHLAVQVDPASTAVSSSAARDYLAEYFGRESNPSLGLFWGSVTDFATAVHAEGGVRGE